MQEFDNHHPHIDQEAFPHGYNNPEVGDMYASGELRLPAPTFSTEGTDDAGKAALDQVNAAARDYNETMGESNKIVMGDRKLQQAETAAGLAVDEALGGTQAAEDFKKQNQQR